MNRIIRIASGALCLLLMTLSVSAAEIDSGSVYCFGASDFGKEPISGICITALPEAAIGTVNLGDRILRPGDVLTASQIDSMTFSPAPTTQNRAAQLRYLPILPGSVQPEAEMTISIRGKADKAPIAEDSAAETYKNLEITGKLKVTEPEKQSMTFAVVRQPKRGSVTISEDGSFIYTPKKNKIGIDSFTYTATDASGNASREATVTITILKPTDAAMYTDTAGRECCFAAEWMKNTGIFVGETIGGKPCFSPDKSVTRGEFVTMLVKALNIPTDEEVTVTGYEDVPIWLQPYLAAAIRSGLTTGLPSEDAFQPDTDMDWETAEVMVCNGLKLDGLSDWEGSGSLTRADAATMLCSAIRQSPDWDTKR